jgi:beta-glucosidase
MLSRNLLACLAFLPTTLGFAQPLSNAWTGDSRLDAKVNELLGKMTIEEKIGQLQQYSSNDELTGPATASDVLAEIRAGRCGSMLNVTGAAYSKKLQTVAVKETRLGIPLLFGYDVIHGFKTVFPINLGQAASWDLEAIENSEHIAATEAGAAGIHWTFSPMVDIARDPRWGRMSEGSGEDVYLGSRIAEARVRGFQGKDLSQTDTVLACAKHFAAYGAAQAGRDYHSTDVSERTLRDIYLPPFKAAVEAGVGSFMAAFNDLNGVPASGNAWLMETVLRKEWGFRGFVVSDWQSVLEMIPHGYAANQTEAAQRGFTAGVDMDMMGNLYTTQLPALLKKGAVTEEQITTAAGRILAAKAKLGLLDDPFRYNDEAREKSVTLTSSHLEAARDLARRSMVLLKNGRDTLPIRKGAKIALIGALADSQVDLLGSWSGRGDKKDVVTIRTGLVNTYGKENVVYAKGAEVESENTTGFAEAVNAAKKADVIVAVLGETREMSGEGHSRTSLGLPGKQAQLLAALHETGKPVAVVLLCGRALALEDVLPLADAWLVAWFPGTMGGPAVADVVVGDYNPSGKLPVTFPRNVGQVPIFYSHKSTGRPQPEGKRVQYRSNYIDAPNSPLFTFGYGLSYTKFSYGNLRVSSDSMKSKGEPLTVTVSVENDGSFDGAETVQLYVRDLYGSVTRPVRELKGFKKIFLKKGERSDVSFTLTPADLSFWRSDMTFGTEPGDFEVYVGTDADASLKGKFSLHE